MISIRLIQNTVNGARKSLVFFGDAIAFVVGAEFNPHNVVGIVEGRMMIHLLCYQRHTSHECEGLIEVFKSKFTDEFLVSFMPHTMRGFCKNTKSYGDLFFGVAYLRFHILL